MIADGFAFLVLAVVGRKSVAWRAKPLRSSLYKRFSGPRKQPKNAPPRSKKQALPGALVNLRARGLFGNVIADQLFLQPVEHGGRYDQGAQLSGEAVHQRFFAGVWLRTLSAVPGAMVVQIASFLEFTHEGTSTMATCEEAGEGEIVFDLTILSLMTSVEDLLAAFPDLPSHKRLMNSLINRAAVFEFTRVDAVPQNLMKRCHWD